MDIKRICLFVPDREKNSADGKLRYRIKWNDNTVAFNVGYRVDIAKWSNDTQRCKNNTTHGKKKIQANVINRAINRFEELANSVFSSFEAAKKIPTTDEFKTAFNLANGKIKIAPSDKTIFDRFDEFTTEMSRINQWSESTLEKFRAIRKHLFNFSDRLEFTDFTEKGLVDYICFLRDDKNMRNSTISKQLGFLKWFLKWADAKGYNPEKAYLAFTPKLKSNEKKIIFLDWDELMTVYNFDFPERFTGLRCVRDVFCFCCFTSLRYSDVANLKRSNIFEKYISITTIKTADSLKIELNNFAKSILDKYKDQAFPKNLALPIISNQKMNDALKEIGKICGIDKPINVTYYKGSVRYDDIFPKYALLSTHAGRRTFICNALMLGIPAQVVMKWTGHSDYKAMKPYIDVADSTKEDAMNLFNLKSPVAKNGD